MSGTFPEAVPASRLSVGLPVSECVFICVCFHTNALGNVCVNKPPLESFIIGAVSAVAPPPSPEGNGVEMRARQTDGGGRRACARACHRAVPSGDHVLQMNTSDAAAWSLEKHEVFAAVCVYWSERRGGVWGRWGR